MSKGTMTPQQHDKWLRKMGAHPDQLKASKPTRVKQKYKGSTVAASYYEQKSVAGTWAPKEQGQQISLANRKIQLKVQEENRTSPRDLGGDRDYTA